MADYINKAAEEGSDFTALAEDDEFKKDLVRFFSGGRYKYSKEQMREKGFDGLAKEFAQHMRWQSWNELTAMEDYSYVNNKDLPKAGKEAFGRLMEAWDTSSSAGTGLLDTVGDISGAVLMAPSTYVGLGSFGLAKVGSKAAQYTGQIALREAIKKAGKSSLMNSAVKRSAAAGALSGATIDGGQAILQGETREEVIEDYDYSVKDAMTDAAIGATIGGTVGGVMGKIGGARDTKIADMLSERKKVFAEEAAKAAEEAKKTLDNADDASKTKAMEILSDLDEVLGARAGVKGASLKDPLDPKRVAKGKAILGSLGDTSSDLVFDSGLSADTMRKIAAASIDVIDVIKQKSGGLRKGERITETVARALREGDVEGYLGELTNIRNKYGLSKDEFSMIYLSEVSRAGQTLGFASAISRAAGKSDADILFSKGASSLAEEDMKAISAQAIRNSTKKGRAMGIAQDVDAMRIAFMTSQPVTTMRNVRNVGIMLGADIFDEINKALYKGLSGDLKVFKDFIPNMSANLRGYTFNKTEAQFVRELMMEEMPEQAMRLYNHAIRLDVALEGNSMMAKAGRFVNLANSASDSVFKEGMFFGSLDRQFREQGETTLAEWLKTNQKLDQLPQGISIEAAVEEANRLTMQRSFRGEDSAVAKATKGLADLNRKAPFIVSQGLGIPFPRYMGNHINTMMEYTPFLGEALHRMNVISGSSDDATRFARQMTGLQAMVAGYIAADMRGGEVDYGSIKKEMGTVEDMKPYIGSYMLHMWLGDRSWRINNGMPVSEGADLQRELSDVFGGIPDFSFDTTFLVEGVKSLADMDTTEKFDKELGNFLSTFTMPAAIARDVLGQFSYESAGSPYVRDLGLSSDVNPDLGDVLTNQATRMLPDSEFIQYTQSFNGKTDIPLYSIANPVAIGKSDPLIKQITGSTKDPALTDLQIEMNKAGIKDWQIYQSYNVSPNVDLLVRARLANRLYRDFDTWRNNAPASKQFGDLKYDEIPDPKKRAELLANWIKGHIKLETQAVEEMFDAYIANPDTRLKARGYVRNNYEIQKKRIGESVFDEVASTLGYNSAEEYLADSDSVQTEIERRMSLLEKVGRLLPNEPY